MYPMDYEEFQWAMGRDMRPALLREALKRRKPLGQVHRSLMQDFRLYMLVGGMPQAVSEYLDSQNLESVDEVKRGIIRLYDNDFDRIDDSHRLARLFDAIPGQLARNVSRYMPRNVVGPLAAATQDRFISEMGASMTVNICNHILDPANGVSMGHNMDCFKMYLGDTGLFVTLAFKGKDFTENTIYQKLLTDKLPANLGYLYENIVAQMLRASGYELFYYTFPSDSKHLYEVDFLLADRDKVDPIEVKSSSYKTHASLDAFCRKYSGKIGTPIVVNTKDMTWENGILYIPPYFVPFLSEL